MKKFFIVAAALLSAHVCFSQEYQFKAEYWRSKIVKEVEVKVEKYYHLEGTKEIIQGSETRQVLKNIYEMSQALYDYADSNYWVALGEEKVFWAKKRTSVLSNMTEEEKTQLAFDYAFAQKKTAFWKAESDARKAEFDELEAALNDVVWSRVWDTDEKEQLKKKFDDISLKHAYIQIKLLKP